MKIQVVLSSQLSELVNYLPEDLVRIEIIENPFEVVQMYMQDSLVVTFVIASTVTDEILNYLKGLGGKKALVNMRSQEVDEKVAMSILEYNVEYLEFPNLKELSSFIETLVKNLLNIDENEEMLMLQKQEEAFKPNQIWLKFLSSIPGVSQSKAQAISEVYPSLTELVLGYGKVPEEQRGNMLKDIKVDSGSLGQVVSNKIFTYINADDPKLTL